MKEELNFKVILVSMDKTQDLQEAIASLLSATFHVPEIQTRSLLTQLPLVLFENLSTADLNALKDHLIFFSKLGLEFSITQKPASQVPRAGWTPSVSIPIVSCPSCGEMFYLLRAKDFAQQMKNLAIPGLPGAPAVLPSAHAKTAPAKESIPPAKAPAPAMKSSAVASKEAGILPAASAAKPAAPSKSEPLPVDKKAPKPVAKPAPKDLKTADELGGISAEFENVDVLSAELESIADMEEKQNSSALEEIEEVGSISEEMKDADSFEGDFRGMEDSAFQVKKPSPPVAKPKASVKKIEESANISGISEEFEEIEGVSAEFEQICMEGMENDIGSLSAEMEEIDSMSSELESVGMEKIGEVSETFNQIASAKPGKEANLPAKPGASPLSKASFQDAELEELHDISKELEGIDDSIPAPTPISFAMPKSPDPTARGKNLDSTPLSPKKGVEPALGSKKSAESTPPAEETSSKKRAPLSLEAGAYKALVNFSGKGDLKAGTQLLAKIKGISEQEAAEMVKNRAALVVASNISRSAAEGLLKEFEKYNMQGRIISSQNI